LQLGGTKGGEDACRQSHNDPQEQGRRQRCGVLWRHLVKKRLQRAREEERAQEANPEPQPDQSPGARQHETNDIARPSAKGHSDADLGRTPTDGVAEDTVEPDRGEQEGDQREDRKELGGEALSREGVADELGHRAHGVEWLRGVEAGDRRAHGITNLRRRVTANFVNAGPGDVEAIEAAIKKTLE
jgi:hypothetical protein